MKERIDYIDTAKGILIIMMLIGHIWNVGFVHNFIYTFHMPAFFVISGILFHHSSSINKNFWGYFCVKVRTFLIPYFCFEVYAIVIYIFQNGMTLNVKGYIYEILTLHLYNGPLWFLFVMFLSEMLFILWYKFGNNEFRCLLLVLLFIVILHLPQFSQYINITMIIVGLFFILVGYTYEIYFVKRCNTLMIIALLVTIIISLMNCGRGMPDYQNGNRILFVIGAILGSYFILQIGHLIPFNVVRFWGKNSLIILGSHYPILRLIKNVSSVDKFSVISGMACFLLIILIEIPIIYFINNLCPFILGKSFHFKEVSVRN